MGKTILTPNQSHFLELAARDAEITKWFYFAGGTALSEFYLHHRLSEDLDFFSENTINELLVDSFMQKTAKRLRARLDKEVHMAILIYRLHFNNQPTLKVDFATIPFDQLERGVHFQNLRIASLWDIVVDKFYTITNRIVARDFVDLYFGVEKVGCDIPQLIAAVEEKYEFNMGEISMASHFLRVKDLTDFPTMLVQFDKKKMEKFFLRLAKSLEDKIFE